LGIKNEIEITLIFLAKSSSASRSMPDWMENNKYYILIDRTAYFQYKDSSYIKSKSLR